MTDRLADPGRFALQPAYFALARALAARLVADFGVAPGRRTVVGVAGESGSGKSITATCLAHELSAAGLLAGVLHQDDYFRRPPRANHDHRVLDLRHVGPHEVNLALVAEHVAAFRAGTDGVTAPVVDYPTDRFLTQRLDFGALAVLVVEGTYVLGLDDLDVRVFLEATHEDTRERRRARARDVDAPIIDEILAIEHALIAPQGAVADLVVDREFLVRRVG